MLETYYYTIRRVFATIRPAINDFSFSEAIFLPSASNQASNAIEETIAIPNFISGRALLHENRRRRNNDIFSARSGGAQNYRTHRNRCAAKTRPTLRSAVAEKDLGKSNDPGTPRRARSIFLPSAKSGK